MVSSSKRSQARSHQIWRNEPQRLGQFRRTKLSRSIRGRADYQPAVIRLFKISQRHFKHHTMQQAKPIMGLNKESPRLLWPSLRRNKSRRVSSQSNCKLLRTNLKEVKAKAAVTTSQMTSSLSPSLATSPTKSTTTQRRERSERLQKSRLTSRQYLARPHKTLRKPNLWRH